MYRVARCPPLALRGDFEARQGRWGARGVPRALALVLYIALNFAELLHGEALHRATGRGATDRAVRCGSLGIGHETRSNT